MKRGFTIIELIVAMSLVILLVAIGLPRYNDLSRKTEFGDGSQKL
jgi:prepilin-type N-terminal cleavage/methylation domain-containing protein